jgi:dipeptidyl aminopeptidase/acylaminoacyl peptidase
MLGTTGNVAALEGTLGEHIGVGSQVACVVDQYGPTELTAMGGRHDDAGSPESLLIGGAVQENKEAARNASPTTYVSKDDPPFLLIHGTNDPAVPFNQSELLAAALQKAGVEALLVPVTGGGHGNFATPAVPERLRQFFDKHLLGKDIIVATTPIAAGTSGRRSD